MSQSTPSPRVIVPPNPTRPAWIVPRDELVDFTHVGKVPFYPIVEQLLHSQFHQSSFLPRQVAAINSAIRGFDLLLSLPTSAGKSLCYQLPAIFNETSITIVVSPTKTLIENQIQSLHSLGPHWHNWAQRSHSDYRQSPSRLLSPSTSPRIFYICPEWLLNSTNQKTLHTLLATSRISRIIIDEAHNALSGLSGQHRVAYKPIFSLRNNYPDVPFTLVSASLTLEHQFRLTIELDARGQFYSVSAPGNGYTHRSNFHYRVVHIPSTVGQRIKRGQGTLKLAMIVKYIELNPERRGFVFVPTRKLARSVGESLQKRITGAEWYHAGEQERLPDVMTRFNEGHIRVLVCTSAFGEGIDNKLVDFVFHYALPQSMTRYFQETGRVGRNGQDAECILFYSFSDIRPLINVIAHDVPSTTTSTTTTSTTTPSRIFHPSQRAELQRVLEYCTDTFTCRHKRMYSLFQPPPTTFYSSTPATRMEALYTRATYHTLGAGAAGIQPPPLDGQKPEKKHSRLGPAGVNSRPPPPAPDEDCGGCDVCDRRYPDLPHDGNDDDAETPTPTPPPPPPAEFNEMDQFEEITALEVDAVENAFRNDTTMLLSDLVRRLSAVGGPATKMKGVRASEVVEFLAVMGVLKLVYVYVGSGRGVGFRVMVEKGSRRIDNIHRPLPIPYTALGRLDLSAVNPSRKTTRKKRARASTEDTFIDNTGALISEAESEGEWAPSGSEDDEDEGEESGEDEDEDEDGDGTRSQAGADNEEYMQLSPSDTEVMNSVLPDEEDTEDIEDGSGTRLRYLRSHKRKHELRSSSFELPDPPSSFLAESTPNVVPGSYLESDVDMEEREASPEPPMKRRRVGRERDTSNERSPTQAERLLARFEEAAKKRGDRDLIKLISRASSKRMLRKLFGRSESIFDEGGFAIALGELGVSKVDKELLLDWYSWIAHEVLATGFYMDTRQSL